MADRNSSFTLKLLEPQNMWSKNWFETSALSKTFWTWINYSFLPFSGIVLTCPSAASMPKWNDKNNINNNNNYNNNNNNNNNK